MNVVPVNVHIEDCTLAIMHSVGAPQWRPLDVRSVERSMGKVGDRSAFEQTHNVSNIASPLLVDHSLAR